MSFFFPFLAITDPTLSGARWTKDDPLNTLLKTKK